MVQLRLSTTSDLISAFLISQVLYTQVASATNIYRHSLDSPYRPTPKHVPSDFVVHAPPTQTKRLVTRAPTNEDYQKAAAFTTTPNSTTVIWTTLHNPTPSDPPKPTQNPEWLSKLQLMFGNIALSIPKLANLASGNKTLSKRSEPQNRDPLLNYELYPNWGGHNGCVSIKWQTGNEVVTAASSVVPAHASAALGRSDHGDPRVKGCNGVCVGGMTTVAITEKPGLGEIVPTGSYLSVEETYFSQPTVGLEDSLPPVPGETMLIPSDARDAYPPEQTAERNEMAIPVEDGYLQELPTDPVDGGYITEGTMIIVVGEQQQPGVSSSRVTPVSRYNGAQETPIGAPTPTSRKVGPVPIQETPVAEYVQPEESGYPSGEPILEGEVYETAVETGLALESQPPPPPTKANGTASSLHLEPTYGYDNRKSPTSETSFPPDPSLLLPPGSATGAADDFYPEPTDGLYNEESQPLETYLPISNGTMLEHPPAASYTDLRNSEELYFQTPTTLPPPVIQTAPTRQVPTAARNSSPEPTELPVAEDEMPPEESAYESSQVIVEPTDSAYPTAVGSGYIDPSDIPALEEEEVYQSSNPPAKSISASYPVFDDAAYAEPTGYHASEYEQAPEQQTYQSSEVLAEPTGAYYMSSPGTVYIVPTYSPIPPSGKPPKQPIQQPSNALPEPTGEYYPTSVGDGNMNPTAAPLPPNQEVPKQPVRQPPKATAQPTGSYEPGSETNGYASIPSATAPGGYGTPEEEPYPAGEELPLGDQNVAQSSDLYEPESKDQQYYPPMNATFPGEYEVPQETSVPEYELPSGQPNGAQPTGLPNSGYEPGYEDSGLLSPSSAISGEYDYPTQTSAPWRKVPQSDPNLAQPTNTYDQGFLGTESLPFVATATKNRNVALQTTEPEYYPSGDENTIEPTGAYDPGYQDQVQPGPSGTLLGDYEIPLDTYPPINPSIAQQTNPVSQYLPVETARSGPENFPPLDPSFPQPTEVYDPGYTNFPPNATVPGYNPVPEETYLLDEEVPPESQYPRQSVGPGDKYQTFLPTPPPVQSDRYFYPSTPSATFANQYHSAEPTASYQGPQVEPTEGLVDPSYPDSDLLAENYPPEETQLPPENPQPTRASPSSPHVLIEVGGANGPLATLTPGDHYFSIITQMPGVVAPTALLPSQIYEPTDIDLLPSESIYPEYPPEPVATDYAPVPIDEDLYYTSTEYYEPYTGTITEEATYSFPTLTPSAPRARGNSTFITVTSRPRKSTYPATVPVHTTGWNSTVSKISYYISTMRKPSPTSAFVTLVTPTLQPTYRASCLRSGSKDTTAGNSLASLQSALENFGENKLSLVYTNATDDITDMDSYKHACRRHWCDPDYNVRISQCGLFNSPYVSLDPGDVKYKLESTIAALNSTTLNSNNITCTWDPKSVPASGPGDLYSAQLLYGLPYSEQDQNHGKEKQIGILRIKQESSCDAWKSKHAVVPEPHHMKPPLPRQKGISIKASCNRGVQNSTTGPGLTSVSLRSLELTKLNLLNGLIAPQRISDPKTQRAYEPPRKDGYDYSCGQSICDDSTSTIVYLCGGNFTTGRSLTNPGYYVQRIQTFMTAVTSGNGRDEISCGWNTINESGGYNFEGDVIERSESVNFLESRALIRGLQLGVTCSMLDGRVAGFIDPAPAEKAPVLAPRSEKISGTATKPEDGGLAVKDILPMWRDIWTTEAALNITYIEMHDDFPCGSFWCHYPTGVVVSFCGPDTDKQFSKTSWLQEAWHRWLGVRCCLAPENGNLFDGSSGEAADKCGGYECNWDGGGDGGVYKFTGKSFVSGSSDTKTKWPREMKFYKSTRPGGCIGEVDAISHRIIASPEVVEGKAPGHEAPPVPTGTVTAKPTTSMATKVASTGGAEQPTAKPVPKVNGKNGVDPEDQLFDFSSEAGRDEVPEVEYIQPQKMEGDPGGALPGHRI